jgi:hypothetical protein
MKKNKYYIVLFCNNKKIKVLYGCQKLNTLYEHWREFKTQKKPRFLKIQGGKRKQELIFEIALIFPNNRWSTKSYVKDKLGRVTEAKIENEKLRIKEILPYWKEELIYDFQKKKHVRYHNVLEEIMEIKEIAQIFTLNNKLFVQNENDIKLFGNKNIKDSERLFDLLREDILIKNKGNFIFVKDINTHQRSTLYTLLESKGFKRTELFRHYSY